MSVVEGQSEVIVEGERAILSVRGFHSIEDAQSCASKLERFAKRHHDDGGHVFVDISGITGFSRDARQRWQDCFKQISTGVRAITIVGGTPMARMAGAAVCLYAGIKFSTAPTMVAALAGADQRAS